MSHAIVKPFGPADDATLSRHTLLRLAVGGAGAVYLSAMGYPVYQYLASPVEKAAEEAAVTAVALKDAQRLPVGNALMFKFGWQPSMLIHHADGTWSAFSAVCTHLGCTVQYQPELHRIHCACHGGVYDDRTGANVSGPPPRPLRRYEVKLVADGGVIVSRIGAT
jgi:cytochrome b6-f complex iron-sulfur subunit